MKNKILFGFFVILLSVSFFSFVSAEIIVSDIGVEYESEIEEYFNNQLLIEQAILNKNKYSSSVEIINNKTWIRVDVMLKKDINSDYSPSIKNPEEREKYLEDIKIQINEAQEAIIQKLSKSEFKDINKLQITSGFFITITSKGFEELINDPNVKKINLLQKYMLRWM